MSGTLKLVGNITLRTPDEILHDFSKNRQEISERVIQKIAIQLEKSFTGAPVKMWIEESRQNFELVQVFVEKTMSEKGWTVKMTKHLESQKDGENIELLVGPRSQGQYNINDEIVKVRSLKHYWGGLLIPFDWASSAPDVIKLNFGNEPLGLAFANLLGEIKIQSDFTGEKISIKQLAANTHLSIKDYVIYCIDTVLNKKASNL